VTDIISEIAAASEEQRTGIEQVNQAIVQMDQVTQQNAALVEQAAAAAEAMQEQAGNLAGLVGTFQTGTAGQAAAIQPPRPVRRASAARAVVPVPVRATRPAAPARTREPVAAGGDWEAF
jgi:methyl-accepting chemotaxis protein